MPIQLRAPLQLALRQALDQAYRGGARLGDAGRWIDTTTDKRRGRRLATRKRSSADIDMYVCMAGVLTRRFQFRGSQREGCPADDPLCMAGESRKGVLAWPPGGNLRLQDCPAARWIVPPATK